VLVEPATAATAAAAAASAATHSAAALNFSKVLAVALGYAVLAGSLFRSVPQIVKVMKLSSTEGLSLTSYVVELCCYSVVIAYNISQVRFWPLRRHKDLLPPQKDQPLAVQQCAGIHAETAVISIGLDNC
jgi:uncharacterized protein with PQ loop repeat